MLCFEVRSLDIGIANSILKTRAMSAREEPQVARIIVGTKYLSPVWAAVVADEAGERAEAMARASRLDHTEPIKFGIEFCPRIDTSSHGELPSNLPEGLYRFRLPSLTKAMYKSEAERTGMVGFLRLNGQKRSEGLIDDSPVFSLAGDMPIVIGASAVLEAFCNTRDGIYDKLIAVPSLEIENAREVLRAGIFAYTSNAVGKIAEISDRRVEAGGSPATLCWNVGNVYKASGVEQAFKDLACFKNTPIVPTSVRLEVGPLPFLHARHKGNRLFVCNLLARALEINPSLDVIFEICGFHTFATRVAMAGDWADYLGVIIADEDQRRKESVRKQGALNGFPHSVSD
ncbi:MAG: hypothetical protein BWY43_00570 [candidate division WS2 bacterium ADurb.Bin280]|uniref:Uncharacterized protein n=1 Tax=candidate division WS2 bacterium ADurb.Bin280 TaxID=1852829 RepID=A0A1V5SCP5_9BACT|nr:MAG: hypothetical protein BWY43_00570 [candidate division WS2 bacterium ADurb.Bin280]